MGQAIQAGRVWINGYHLYPAHFAVGGYKTPGFGHKAHQLALEHYQQVLGLLVSDGITQQRFF